MSLLGNGNFTVTKIKDTSKKDKVVYRDNLLDVVYSFKEVMTANEIAELNEVLEQCTAMLAEKLAPKIVKDVEDV